MKKLLIILGGIFENNKIYSKLEDHNKNMLNANFWQDKQIFLILFVLSGLNLGII